MEAGRKKGSIKKSRPLFAELIAAIEEAAELQVKPRRRAKEVLEKAKGKAENYRALYEASLGREVMLIRENAELKKELAKLKSKVVNIR